MFNICPFHGTLVHLSIIFIYEPSILLVLVEWWWREVTLEYMKKLENKQETESTCDGAEVSESWYFTHI
jgi:hypothetical protein